MSDSVSVTTVVRVDPATAFAIFTNEIDRWWSRGPLHRSQETMRFDENRLLRGGEEIARVLAWQPAERLLLAWHKEGEVEVRFTPVGDGTRVTLEHRRLASADSAYRSQTGLWWARLLTGFRSRTGQAGAS